MSSKPTPKEITRRAKTLRATSTKSEQLLWSMLRARQLSNLKFRRQYSIPPFFVDFACVSRKLIIEIDGGYHDLVADQDLQREAYLRDAGWDILRFTDKEVTGDVEAVGMAIADYIGIEYQLVKRSGGGSGMFSSKRSS